MKKMPVCIMTAVVLASSVLAPIASVNSSFADDAVQPSTTVSAAKSSSSTTASSVVSSSVAASTSSAATTAKPATKSVDTAPSSSTVAPTSGVVAVAAEYLNDKNIKYVVVNNSKGIYYYQQPDLTTGKVTPLVKAGTLIPLATNPIVQSGNTTRLKTANGYYISGNKEYVKAIDDTKAFVDNPGNVLAQKNVTLYGDVEGTQAKSTVAKDTLMNVTAVSFSATGKTMLQVSGGYIENVKSSYKVITGNIANYLTTKPTQVILKKNANEYSDANLKNKVKSMKMGTIVKIAGLAWSNGGTPRLKMANGHYVTANVANVIVPTKNIASYYVTNPKKLVSAKKVNGYRDVTAPASSKNNGFVVGTYFTIKALEYTNDGVPRFKLSNGLYVTAGKKSYRTKLTKTIKNYWTIKLGKTKLKKKLYLYKDVNLKTRVKAYKKGTAVNVTGVGWTKGGTPRMKVKGGYLSATKAAYTYKLKAVKINQDDSGFYASKNNATNFITKYAADVRAVTKSYGLYGSIQMAQASLESAWGASALTKQGLNFFGIKGAYSGQSVIMRTAEYDSKGNLYYVNAAFKKYPNAKASFTDNAKLLKNGPGFSSTYYSGAWRSNAKTYQAAAQGLVGRYATDPAYATKLVSLINSYDLHKLLD